MGTVQVVASAVSPGIHFWLCWIVWSPLYPYFHLIEIEMATQSGSNETHVLSEQDLIELGERYEIKINPDDVTQYKLCQVILALEQEISLQKHT